MHEIFISYSRRDIATVQTLTTALSQQGVTVWVDKSDIQEGDAYDTQIEEAIAQTNVVIVLWSEHSVKSHWVRAEAAYALAKHKLLPISIDRSQPPLQFMQIQTLDFCSWQGSCEDEAFERLLVDLARRLNRQFSVSRPVAGAAIPPTAPGIATVAKADAGHNWITGAFAAGMVAVGLRFPEKIIENEFQDYFCNRMYAIAQFGMLLAFIAYVVYGVSDLASDAAISSTRFRYMVASPLLLLLYFMSFKEFAKKHSQLYISALRGYAWHLPLYHGSVAWDRDTLPHRDWKRNDELHVGVGSARLASTERRFDCIDWHCDNWVARAHYD